MKKEAIIQELNAGHKRFADFILLLSERDFRYSPPGKWDASQQLDHICRALSPLALGLRLPKWVMRRLFGRANRPSRTYDELVKKYLAKLAMGGKASGRFIPGKIDSFQKDFTVNKLLKLVQRLAKNIESFSEQELDKYILPHPLLGKLTVREMMFFTIYHVEHHLQQARHNLGW